MAAKFLIAASIFCLLLSLPLLAQTETPSGDPPDRTARLSYMEGAVSFEPAGEDNWSQAALNYPLTSGDRLWTDKEARAELETGNVAIRMSAETDLTTTSLADQLIQVGLAQGTVRIRSFDMQAGHEIEVDTPNAALTIVRPGDYRVDTFPDQNVTMVTVNQGELQITANDVNQTLSSGQAVKLATILSQSMTLPFRAPTASINGAAAAIRNISTLGRDSTLVRTSPATMTSILTEAGKWWPNTVPSGIRPACPADGCPTATAGGSGSNRGVGPGSDRRLGALPHTITDDGYRSVRAGAGCPDLS